MTNEQKNLIDSLRQQASSIYDKMDKQEVDYDKFKQIADASLLKADQAQKIYNNLYKVFIYYPSFIKSLAKIKDDARAISDEYQKTLKEKYDSFYYYKKDYDDTISLINENLLLINAQELAIDIQGIINEKDSLTYSYELVDTADDYAMQKAEALLKKDILTGIEACLDKNGKQIDMSVCRPRLFTPTVIDITNRKLDDWIQVIGVASKSNNVEELINIEKATSQDATKREEATKNKVEEIVDKNDSPEIVDKFKVDVSRITKDKQLLDKTAPSPRQQNINYALCSAKKTFLKENYVSIGYTDSSIYLTTLYIGNVLGVSVKLKQDVKIGQQIRLFKANNIYMVGIVDSYEKNISFLAIKVTGSVGEGVYSGFDLQLLESIEEKTQFIINNPVYTFANGMDWADYSKSIDATSDEIAIARASCPSSDISSEYYKQDSNIKSFDGANISKNKLTPLYVLAGGLSLFFILKYALKKNK